MNGGDAQARTTFLNAVEIGPRPRHGTLLNAVEIGPRPRHGTRRRCPPCDNALRREVEGLVRQV
jgi:hypothetical protein